MIKKIFLMIGASITPLMFVLLVIGFFYGFEIGSPEQVDFVKNQVLESEPLSIPSSLCVFQNNGATIAIVDYGIGDGTRYYAYNLSNFNFIGEGFYFEFTEPGMYSCSQNFGGSLPILPLYFIPVYFEEFLIVGVVSVVGMILTIISAVSLITFSRVKKSPKRMN